MQKVLHVVDSRGVCLDNDDDDDDDNTHTMVAADGPAGLHASFKGPCKTKRERERERERDARFFQIG